MVNNFPLSLQIFKVNFTLSADDLAFLTVNEITSFLHESILPTFSSKFSILTIFFGPKTSTPTPKQGCNFGTRGRDPGTGG